MEQIVKFVSWSMNVDGWIHLDEEMKEASDELASSGYNQ